MMAVFWFLAVAAVYSYALYPFVLAMIPARRRVESGEGAPLPPITVIIAARNEELRIRQKLVDTLEQGYPRELLQVLVVSDCSTDATDEIVEEFGDRGVCLLRKEHREGKEAAQALGISQARGDVLVFSDVATRMGPGSLRAIVAAFADPSVGAVSSEDRFESDKQGGEGAYLRYEMALRRLESARAGLVGLSGSFFAIRKEVARNWRTDIPSDFVAALNSVRLGLRGVSDRRVLGIYPDLAEDTDEFKRKRRTAIRGMSALVAMRDLLNPFKYGLFAFQLWSHKVMRWAVPWLLLALFVASLVLAPASAIVRLAVVLQILFYAAAFLGWVSTRLRRHAAIRLPYYFVQVNAALAVAFLDLLRGRRVVVWEPSKR